MNPLPLCSLLLLLSTSVALAQPSATPPQDPAACQRACCACGALAYPMAYDLRLTLTSEELDLLAEGELSTGRYVTGGVISSMYGFGIGHIIQGRWAERGWIFTVGETVGAALLISGVEDYVSSWSVDHAPTERQHRHANRKIVGGLFTLLGFRVVEIVDAWATPPKRNARVRALRRRVGLAGVSPFVAPSYDGGGTAGVVARF
ncbi:MAG: hypothetical protein R3B48_26455 [Kofleriaceae bacterium]